MYKTQQSACWCWIRQDVYIVATIVWLSTSSMFILNLSYLISDCLYIVHIVQKSREARGPAIHLILYHSVALPTILCYHTGCAEPPFVTAGASSARFIYPSTLPSQKQCLAFPTARRRGSTTNWCGSSLRRAMGLCWAVLRIAIYSNPPQLNK